ncbi:MAG: hypothetical protein JXR94_20705 [Candidatus Hydrogenedentes bacterium]|nr:hypothetical protein [Candidatus Hydrogenedentota bacterium]
MRRGGARLMLVAVVLAAAGAVEVAWGAEAIDRAELGRSVKLTILVDKVMQPEAGWTTEEWMVKASAEAGFNVFSPRKGHDKLDEVRAVTGWCEQYGIYHMPWMRGTLTAPEGPQADGKRVVWANGNEQPLWSPNSDEFWAWTHQYIVEYARISAENKHLMGVFLDYENYAPGRQGNLYSLSYDDTILGKFAEAQGIELPALALADRRPWLTEQGLHDAFEAFQIAHWRDRCRALREAVDAHDPTFQFCIYPAPGTRFMIEATYPEWATERAPIILADPSTYGRPSRFARQERALAANRELLIKRRVAAEEAGIPFIYAGGIDPVVKGADPEFSGKNAVMMSEVTDGYWIFYEGPTYTKQDHAEYWKWFTWANRAIAAGRFDAQHEARETPENWALDVFAAPGQGPALVPPEAGGAAEYPLVQLRGDNLLVVVVRAGEAVEIGLQNRPVGRYESPLTWEVRNVVGDEVAAGSVAHNESGKAAFTPAEDGLYVIAVSAGGCAYSVTGSTVPVGLHTGDGLRLIRGAEGLYFSVPEGVKKFTIRAQGAGAETVRVNVRNPAGEQVATGQTAINRRDVTIEVAAGDAASGVWSLEVTNADEGTLEDNWIKLDAQLAPLLSLVREQVFRVTR